MVERHHKLPEAFMPDRERLAGSFPARKEDAQFLDLRSQGARFIEVYFRQGEWHFRSGLICWDTLVAQSSSKVRRF